MKDELRMTFKMTSYLGLSSLTDKPHDVARHSALLSSDQL